MKTHLFRFAVQSDARTVKLVLALLTLGMFVLAGGAPVAMGGPDGAPLP